MGTIYTLAQPCVAGTAYQFPAFVVSQADTDVFQTSVTLAAGDVKVSKDGGGYSNIAALPTEVGTDGELTTILSTGETTGATKYITVKFHDAADDEWQDVAYIVPMSTAVTDYATSSALATVDGNVDAILADTGTDGVVLADGAITADKIATNAITAAKVAADAITSSELAASAAQEIADAILARGVDNVEDSADAASLAALILAAFESAVSGTTWTIYKTDHETTFATRTVTPDSSASLITEVT